tara:strand:+ start:206 stop:1639 length:1434 start_codon:yes stop_codon:yes gene_type:complete
MTSTPHRRGIVQTDRGRTKNILKGRKNRFRSLIMLGLVAFIMLSPQAREMTMGKISEAKEFITNPTSGYLVYDIEADYTLNRIVTFQNEDSDMNEFFNETLPISPDVYAVENSNSMYTYTDGTQDLPNPKIQDVTAIELRIDGQSINIPLENAAIRSHADAFITPGGHKVWWPGTSGSGSHFCIGGPCVKVNINLGPNQELSFEYLVTISTKSYTWWSDVDDVDPRIPGYSSGMLEEHSGTFDDFQNRGNGERESEFTAIRWYDKNRPDYAIDATAANVIAAVSAIDSNLPDGNQNAFTFAKAAFDYIRDNIEYYTDPTSKSAALSGPSCLAAGQGDCDEQTNAFLSLLRAKGIPGWYVFGILSSKSYTKWEAHAWGYIQLPMSTEWCNENNIELDSCYVEASVDVTNNKWLLHTASALIDWIEQPDPNRDGTYINAYYRPLSYSDKDGDDDRIQRSRIFALEGPVSYGGGKFPVYS